MLEDIDYYPQVFLQDCRYIFFASNKLIPEALDFTDSEPKSEFEEEFNEDAAERHKNYILKSKSLTMCINYALFMLFWKV